MNCPSYNKYKYGLNELYGYAETLSPQIVRTRMLTRPIIFVLGKADTNRDWGLDKSCEADVQGKIRYERGLLYKHHLRTFVKSSPKSQHIWLEIPEVGHEAAAIFTHPRFIIELKALEFLKTYLFHVVKSVRLISKVSRIQILQQIGNFESLKNL